MNEWKKTHQFHSNKDETDMQSTHNCSGTTKRKQLYIKLCACNSVLNAVYACVRSNTPNLLDIDYLLCSYYFSLSISLFGAGYWGACASHPALRVCGHLIRSHCGLDGSNIHVNWIKRAATRSNAMLCAHGEQLFVYLKEEEEEEKTLKLNQCVFRG